MFRHHFPGPHPGIVGPHPGFGLAVLIVRLVFLALFLLLPLIIGLAYIWPDARRRGQPGWLWALAAIFLSWFGVLTYLVVRTFTRPLAVAAPPAMYPPAAPISPTPYPTSPVALQPFASSLAAPVSDEPPADQPPDERPPEEE